MSDSAARSASTGSAEAWLRPSLNSSASPSLRRDSKNTLYNSPPSLQGSPRTMLAKPSLQDDSSRRPSLSNANSGMPSYAGSAANSRLPSLSQQSRVDGPLGLYQYRRAQSISYTQSLTSSRATGRVPLASPDNDYLGFCKGAWKLQNGDRKGAMEKCKEAQSWSRNASRSTTLAQHLQCSQNKCAFRSNYVSNDGDLIYDKVIKFPGKGVNVRWTFLAKSHVPQKVVIRNQFAYKCLFCVFMGLGARAGVYVGTEYYLDHINADHRGQAMSEVLLFKTNCINDRIAEDDDDFDINLWPLDVSRDDKTQQWLSDSLLGDPANMPRLPPDDSLGANEPWIMDAAYFEDFDAIGEDNSDRATVTTAIHHPPTPKGEVPARRPSVQSEISTPATVVPADFPTPPHQKSPGKFTYAEWEDNPEEIWGANRRTPEDETGQPPSIPARSNARLASIRESRYAPELVPQDSQPSSLGAISPYNFPIGSVDLGITSEDDLAVTNCLKTIINAFKDASTIVDELRKQPTATQSQLFPLLEESIFESPNEIHREWQRGVTRFGPSFEMGDYVAIIALQQITIALHNKLVDALRVAALGKPTDYGQLMDTADSGRHHVISTLHELRKRLMQAPPSLMSGANSFAAERAMSPEPYSGVHPQRSASHPTQKQHIAHIRPDLWKDPYFPNRDPDTAARNGSTSSKDSKHSRAQSDVTGDTTRRASVLNNFTKPKWARKISMSKSPNQSKEDVDDLADGMKSGLKLHQRKASEANGLSEVAELDATPIGK